MLYLTCTIISNIDHARYRESRAKGWVSGACGTGSYKILNLLVAVKTTARKQATTYVLLKP